ncbi:Nucleotidyltransferase domain-containing protein [Candidatus Kryptobacter tengchongensis]|nr:Nucleotidyltransferase domain-containing protein [Candidatus Kryptobacter tengchongensis]
MKGKEDMKEIIKKKVKEIFEGKGIDVLKIILFGSRARGDYKENSDWDILIIVRSDLNTQEKREIAKTIRKVLAEMFIPSDIVIKSQKETEYYKDFPGSVTREALKEGIEI